MRPTFESSSLQVADFNMSRMRVVWGRIWRVLSSHFVEAQTANSLQLFVFDRISPEEQVVLRCFAIPDGTMAGR